MVTVTTVVVERTGPAIRAALAAHAPSEEGQFVAELRSALADAGRDLDLARLQTVLGRWHARAVMAANPLSADEMAQIERAKAGDFTGFAARSEDDSWTTL